MFVFRKQIWCNSCVRLVAQNLVMIQALRMQQQKKKKKKSTTTTTTLSEPHAGVQAAVNRCLQLRHSLTTWGPVKSCFLWIWSLRWSTGPKDVSERACYSSTRLSHVKLEPTVTRGSQKSSRSSDLHQSCFLVPNASCLEIETDQSRCGFPIIRETIEM